jgi:hypothetical protein
MKRLLLNQGSQLLPPFLLAVYPVLLLYATNLDLVPLSIVARLMVLLVAISAGLLWLLRLVAPTLAGRAIVLFVFYANFYLFTPYAITNKSWPARLINGSGPVLIILGVTLLLAILLVRKAASRLSPLTLVLTTFMVVLLAFTLTNVVKGLSTTARPRSFAAADAMIEQNLAQPLQPSTTPPDIYYIILDGYGRSDILQEYFGVQDEEFQNFLRDQGFYVATNSHSNYGQTYFSLASSLNLNYLEPIQQAVGLKGNSRKPLRYLIENNSVARLLRAAGYRYVLLASTYSGTLYSPLADLCRCETYGMTEFERTLLDKTMLGLWLPRSLHYDAHRRKINGMFAELARLPELDSPKFVFAHFLVPHPPFVFAADGSAINYERPFGLLDGSHYRGSREEYVAGYRGQVTYLNRELQKVVAAILANSATPPIIILQGDHGPGSMLRWSNPAQTNMAERFSILNAYYLPGYLPGDGKAALYDTITPVNTFRTIFNQYFGTNWERLEDKSFFGTWNQPYQFLEFTPEPRRRAATQSNP